LALDKDPTRHMQIATQILDLFAGQLGSLVMNYPTLTSLALMTTFVGAAPVAFAQTPAENMANCLYD